MRRAHQARASQRLQRQNDTASQRDASSQRGNTPKQQLQSQRYLLVPPPAYEAGQTTSLR
eukprot:4926371-Pyramimonas_sp.AAC.1